MDDPQLRNEARCCPVQLPLAVSGWVFKEEFEEDADFGGVKTETYAEDEKMNTESSDTAVRGESDADRDRVRDADRERKEEQTDREREGDRQTERERKERRETDKGRKEGMETDRERETNQ